MKREAMIKALRYKAEHIKTKVTPKFFLEVADALEQQPYYNPDEWCRDCKEYDQDKHCCPRYNKVIRKAVEEMKQPCEDTISREQAIDAVANLFEMSEYPHPYPQGKPIRLKDVKEKLKQLPSVQPKSKVGHWIDDEFGSKCSCCGIHTHLDKFDKPMKFKHCSMCGARMVEPQERSNEE